MSAPRTIVEVKVCSRLLVAIGALAVLPALFSAYVSVRLFDGIVRFGWLVYVGAFCLLFAQWVRFAFCDYASRSVRTLWAASVAFFALTLAGTVGSGVYYIWRFFQPEPFTFNGDDPLSFDLAFIPLLASLIPLTGLILSYFLLRHSRECA